MQPFLAIATLVAALGVVAVNSETTYILAPVPHHNRVQRVLSSGWGWKPVRQYTLSLPTIQRGWGWKRPSGGISVGVYGGLRIGPKQQQGWGWQPPKQQHGWGWQPQKQQGWGWQPPKQQHGWGWQPQKQQGWGWGGDDDDDDEDDYRSTVPEIAYDDLEDDADSSEEAADDESGSVESDEEADDFSAEADFPQLDMRHAIAYNPVY